MAFERDYSALLGLAAELGGYSGYLDDEEKLQETRAKALYKGEINRTVFEILAEKPDVDLVLQRVQEDLDGIAEESPEWADVCAILAEDLIAKIRAERGKSKGWRYAKRHGGTAIVASLVVGYFSLWFWNGIAIDQPIETRHGLTQRAEAYEKARDFDDLMSSRTRRGGFLRDIFSKPFEPDDEEIAGATDFVGITFDALYALHERSLVCGAERHFLSEQLQEADFAMLDGVAEELLSDEMHWQDPPAMTLVPILENRFPCAAPDPVN